MIAIKSFGDLFYLEMDPSTRTGPKISIAAAIEQLRRDGFRPATFIEWARVAAQSTYKDCDTIHGEPAFFDESLRNSKGQVCLLLFRDACYHETDHFRFIPIEEDLSKLQGAGCNHWPFIPLMRI